jgi:acetoin utilization deacetylase AcuC-like enzyme
LPGSVFTHPSSLEHDTGAHPERAERIRAVDRALSAVDWLGWERVESPQVEQTVLEQIHPATYIDSIARFVEAGGGALDPDTIASPGTLTAALHAAGGAVAAVDAVLRDGVGVTASLHRPPGHHAEAARAMGFCFFNNVAVAARHAIDALGCSRVMIFDWDVHHGNGTNDIFHGSDEVLFVSAHEWPLYPGTGPATDVGSGRGEGFTVNLPLPGRSGDEVWCSIAEHVVAPLAAAFAPELVLISAGFDAHADDPLATCRVTDDGFAAMAGTVRRFAAGVGAPVGMVLEGGYDVDALGRSVVRVMEVLGADDPPPDPGIERHPLAEQAVARLRRYWPLPGPERP